MKIYTKKGDLGKTSTLGGSILPKHHIKIESYGNVDELNAHIAWLRDLLSKNEMQPILISIQNILFSIGSHLASDVGKDQKLPELKKEFIKELERAIDEFEKELPAMKNFVIPGGDIAVSACHISRTVCRRAERSVSQLSEIEKIDDHILPYLNRLSDFLFVLSRKIGQDLGVKETPWIPKK